MIVFTSAGGDILNEPIEEFRKTLSEFGTAMLFVMDRSPTWFNHSETDDMFALVRKYAKKYETFALLGESMGGSCAITVTNFLPNADRVLALAPQYSIATPFTHFDSRFTNTGKAIPRPRFWSHSHTPIKDRIHILYGTTDWRDEVHAGMYLAEGFKVTFVAGAGHMVAGHLKRADGVNRLRLLLNSFTDFTAPFTHQSVREAVGDLYRTSLDNVQEGYAAERAPDFREFMDDSAPSPPAPPVRRTLRTRIVARVKWFMAIGRRFIGRPDL